jgi:hypothetical protein
VLAEIALRALGILAPAQPPALAAAGKLKAGTPQVEERAARTKAHKALVAAGKGKAAQPASPTRTSTVLSLRWP